MSYYQQTRMNKLPDVVKNLLIINGLFFIASMIFEQAYLYLSLFYPLTEYFMPHQILTHMFMHGGYLHIIINMFMLWMFGGVLENVWGAKRFLIFYLVCGLGAAFIHELTNLITVYSVTGQFYLDFDFPSELIQYSKSELDKVKGAQFSPVVGASGAIFGILMGFMLLFPNTEMMLIFLPIPIKAKYFIPVYMVFELFMGVSNFQADNIAHWAHLGGALFGFILVKIWGKNRNNFY